MPNAYHPTTAYGNKYGDMSKYELKHYPAGCIVGVWQQSTLTWQINFEGGNLVVPLWQVAQKYPGEKGYYGVFAHPSGNVYAHLGDTFALMKPNVVPKFYSDYKKYPGDLPSLPPKTEADLHLDEYLSDYPKSYVDWNKEWKAATQPMTPMTPMTPMPPKKPKSQTYPQGANLGKVIPDMDKRIIALEADKARLDKLIEMLAAMGIDVPD